MPSLVFTNTSSEDLEIEQDNSSQNNLLEKTTDNNELAITKRHPRVVINNAKDREANKLKYALNSSNCELDIEDYILEEVLYTSKAIDDPKNYNQVLLHKNKEDYLLAMKKELEQLKKNNTWSLVPRPSNCPILKGRWVLNQKTQIDKGLIYKARWVAKGFLQEKDINYQETFANTSKPDIIRLLLAIASALDWEIYCWDIKQAFPNALIDTTIYIEQPEGFKDPNYPADYVCLLNKALYGLKQASRQWQKLLLSLLAKLNFTPLLSDTATYINSSKGVIIATHVDDLLIFAKDKQIIKDLFSDLSSISSLEIKDLGEIREFLGVQVIRDRADKSLLITQEQFTSRLLEKFNKEDIKLRQTPLPPNIKLESNKELALAKDIKRFQQEIGSLIYITIFTRPDIAYAVNCLARYMANPSKDHFSHLDYLWGYIRNTRDIGLYYNLNIVKEQNQSTTIEPLSNKTINLIGSTDADWGGDFTTRRSTTGYLFILSVRVLECMKTLSRGCRCISSAQPRECGCTSVVQLYSRTKRV